MLSFQPNIPPNILRKQILSWLETRLDKDAYGWIAEKSENLWKGNEDWEFFSSFSAIPRYIGKGDLELSDKEKKQAKKIRSGWKPEYWSIDQLGRTLIVLSIASREKNEFLELLEKIHQSSDLGEAEALYKSLPVMPYPDDLQAWAAEGIRSNMTSIFNAVSHRNPYPGDYFDDGAWNQMVLKALFVGSPLYLIQKIDERANRQLAEMLIDYAHERWAANRSVSPELWRTVGPFAEGRILEDIQKVLNHPEEIQKQAAALALFVSPSKEAQIMLNKHKGAKDLVEHKDITWNRIGKNFAMQEL